MPYGIKTPISCAPKLLDAISLCLKLSSTCAKTEVVQNEEIKHKLPKIPNTKTSIDDHGARCESVLFSLVGELSFCAMLI